MRWVRLVLPYKGRDRMKRDLDRMMFGGKPHVVDEAPGVVRLATEAETGRFARPALPSSRRSV